MKFNDNFTPTTTSSSTQEPDDISAFLRQLMHRSSSSSSLLLPTLPSTTTMGMHAADHNTNNTTSFPGFLSSSGPSGSDRIQPAYFTVSGGPLLSSNNDYTTEDCDYESEEGAEAAVGEAEERQTQSRNQSKRTRAAEVHNLSEKRRRCKINEKLKALQNLIPNSNKTDKASMLDEAIEYLKQLQLQVQMLSMRNGMSLHPVCLPEDQGIIHTAQLSQIRMHNPNNNTTSFDHINLTNSLNGLPDTSHSTFNLANLHGSSTRPSLSSVANVINSETVGFGLDSCVHPSFQPVQNNNINPCQTLCRDQRLPQERSLTNKHDMKSFGNAMPLSFGVGNSSMEGHHNSLEGHTQTKSASQGLFLENILGQDPSTSSIFSGLHAASSSSRNDKLTIGK